MLFFLGHEDLLAIATNPGRRKLRIKIRDLASGDGIADLSARNP